LCIGRLGQKVTGKPQSKHAVWLSKALQRGGFSISFRRQRLKKEIGLVMHSETIAVYLLEEFTPLLLVLSECFQYSKWFLRSGPVRPWLSCSLLLGYPFCFWVVWPFSSLLLFLALTSWFPFFCPFSLFLFFQFSFFFLFLFFLSLSSAFQFWLFANLG
jgi:hypothetical protein